MPNAWHLTRGAPTWDESDAGPLRVFGWLAHAATLYYVLQYMLATLISGIYECAFRIFSLSTEPF